MTLGGISKKNCKLIAPIPLMVGLGGQIGCTSENVLAKEAVASMSVPEPTPVSQSRDEISCRVFYEPHTYGRYRVQYEGHDIPIRGDEINPDELCDLTRSTAR